MNTITSLDRELSFEQLKKSVLELFPDLVIFAEDPETIYPDEMNWKRLDHVLIRLEFDCERKDFPHCFKIESGLAKYDQRRSLHIARKISNDYNVRTLSEYEYPEYGHLYIFILFDQSKTYLINDHCDYENEGRPASGIEIIREMEIPRYRFDSTGDYIGVLTD